MADPNIYAVIDYEDDYVQPLILAALQSGLPPDLLVYIKEVTDIPSSSSRLLQWRQYEYLDFSHIHSHPLTSLSNSYIIRKALIRKHYLSTTVSHHLSKVPGSVLKHHFKVGAELELDYAEFLDEALIEAWELKESWARNAGAVERAAFNDGQNGDFEKEWWILKPSMSDRGQGIRLFSSEEDLEEIFREWDPDSEDDEDDDGNEDEDEDEPIMNGAINGANGTPPLKQTSNNANGIITSHLRHFVAQPYIHPPLLLPAPHLLAGRKFHIRAYILAVGALEIYVYKPMLALFAAESYISPNESANDNLEAHLTNTCLQPNNSDFEENVQAFWALPPSLPSLAKSKDENESDDWRDSVFTQICATTSEIFLAASKNMSTHFQPLPNAFEIFALDFLLDDKANAWLLEVNAFPDFKQTGEELKGLVAGLFEGVVDVAVKPFFWGEDVEGSEARNEEMRKVLDIDLGRR